MMFLMLKLLLIALFIFVLAWIISPWFKDLYIDWDFD